MDALHTCEVAQLHLIDVVDDWNTFDNGILLFIFTIIWILSIECSLQKTKENDDYGFNVEAVSQLINIQSIIQPQTYVVSVCVIVHYEVVVIHDNKYSDIPSVSIAKSIIQWKLVYNWTLGCGYYFHRKSGL